MSAERVLLSVFLCAPFVLVTATYGHLADHVAKAAVDALLRVTAPLAAHTATATAMRADSPVERTGGVDVMREVEAKVAAPPAPGRPKRATPPPQPKALFVSADTVLGLAKTSARPSGSFVAKTAAHPAGLRLVGVGGLGIGVEDGDILIEALGVAPRSSGQIIGAVIEARARRLRHLSGTLWRNGRTLRITVEQPYLDPA